jgi:Arc/MetJ family transcription regulator
MATNLDIDDKLLMEAKRISGLRTKKDTVNLALEEFIQARKQQDILKYEGKVDFWPDYDHKRLRKAR